jgi:Glutaredoxin-like domain (DUF836)
MAYAQPLRLTLVGRSYCSLCDKMRLALEAAALECNVRVDLTEIDLDEMPAFEAKFGEFVPVLLVGDITTGHEVCHYHFDHAAWDALTVTAR